MHAQGGNITMGFVKRVELENYAAAKCEKKKNICVNLIEL
jgi:hypothetical protein